MLKNLLVVLLGTLSAVGEEAPPVLPGVHDARAQQAVIDSRKAEQAGCWRLPLCSDLERDGANGCASVGMSGDCKMYDDYKNETSVCIRRYVSCCAAYPSGTSPTIVTSNNFYRVCRCSDDDFSNAIWIEENYNAGGILNDVGCKALCGQYGRIYTGTEAFLGHGCRTDSKIIEKVAGTAIDIVKQFPSANGRFGPVDPKNNINPKPANLPATGVSAPVAPTSPITTDPTNTIRATQ